MPSELRSRWHLDIRGDDIALRTIVDKVSGIDFFIYDSDKSFSGRRAAFETIRRKLSPNATVTMDDIQDNTFFRDLVESEECEYFVFEFQGKYVGLIERFTGRPF